MNAIFRGQFLIIALITSNALFAGDGSHSLALRSGFVLSVKDFYKEASAPKKTKICACQILNLESHNQSLENVAILVERTDDGHSSKMISAAASRLEQEKKYMKAQFYNKIQVVSKATVNTDCQTLYRQMKMVNATLFLYELLDGDINTGK